MRETSFVICSSCHLPVEERTAMEDAIRAASRNAEGRLEVCYPDLVIEAHLDGFFVHTSVAGWASAQRPDGISPALWAILTYAAEIGTSWVSFDREVPSGHDWPIFS